MNGGNIAGVTTDVVVETAILGANILDCPLIPEPVYALHTLSGWAFDEAGTNLVIATSDITKNGKVYAVWVDAA